MGKKKPAARAKMALPSISRYGVYPDSPQNCPFARGCKERVCEHKDEGEETKKKEKEKEKEKEKCRRVARIRNAAEREYRKLPQYRTEYAPLVGEAVQARIVIACLDHQLHTTGLTSKKRDGTAIPTELLRERRRWLAMLVRLYSEMCITPRSLAVEEATGSQPMGLLEAIRGARGEGAERYGEDDRE